MQAVVEIEPGAEDELVLAVARRERRILVTNDKDFAALVFLRRRTSFGILLLRLRDWNAEQKGRRLLDVLAGLSGLRRAMVVVTAREIRRRPFADAD